jgi:hypothetical protein
MQLPFVERWILEESPKFALAYEAYYQANVKKVVPMPSDVALFATTYMDRWRAAEIYTGNAQIILNERAWHRKRIGDAVAMGDVDYLRKCLLALQYLLNQEADETSVSDYMTPQRFIIEGYRRLRIVSGQGSPQPTRAEVYQEAIRIWAYYKLCWREGKPQTMPYRAFLDKARRDQNFRERVESETANAKNLFPINHSERLFLELGLNDLYAKRGRPSKNRKGVSKRRSALVKGKKLAKK